MNLRLETGKTLRLAYPIILGEVAQMALGIIDVAMVGAVSYEHLAAAALVLSVINIPFVLGIGLTISISQMVSMAHGQRDSPLVSHYFFNGFWLCVAAALLISTGLEWGKDILYHLDQDPRVVALAYPYLRIMGISVIPMLLFMALKQFTDGLQHTRTAMALSLAAIPLNIFLNWLLIFGNLGFPRMELNGAGIATLITRTVIFLILGWVVLRHRIFRRYVAVSRNQWKFRWHTLKELLAIGIPSSLQMTMEAGAFAISGILIGTISAVAQAAHQIALSLASITFMISIGISQAGSIRVSNNFGGRHWPMISVIGRSTLYIAMAYGAFCALAFSLFRHQLPLLFNENPEVLTLTAYLLIFAAVFQVSDSIQAISAGLLRGIKDVRIPTVFIAIAYWLVGIPVGYLLAFPMEMGAAGIWIGFTAGLSLSALFLSLRFRKMVRKQLKTAVSKTT